MARKLHPEGSEAGITGVLLPTGRECELGTRHATLPAGQNADPAATREAGP